MVAEIYDTYEHALDSECIGIWKWNISKNEMFISEKVKYMTGYNYNSVSCMKDFINIIAYEEDKLLAQKDLKDYLNGYTQFYQSTFRIKSEKGEIKWVLLRGSKTKCKGCIFLSGIIVEVSELKLLERYDGLTLLPNRKLFYKKLCKYINRNKEHNKKGALIYLDLDNFKSLNAEWGSSLGDLILKLFTESVSKLLKKPYEMARLGGDEFAIIIPEFEKIEVITDLCKAIHGALNKPFIVLDAHIFISASIGVTVFPDDSSDPDRLLKYCDFAMYKSKHKGKNMFTIFDKNISDSFYKENMIEDELKNSIINKEFDLVFQPQYDAISNKVIGLESLVRWNKGNLGSISPSEFIPIAERSGYIIYIGNWVLDETLKVAGRWIENGYVFNTISVNVSPIQLRRLDFKDNVLDTCEKYNIPPSFLEIEITEGTLIDLCKDKIAIINELVKNGVRIAIDDFGTGYSSLSYLIELPINTIKIDRSIVNNIDNYKNRAVVKSIVDLSKALQYEIVSEGAESREQVEALKALGCNIIQGYYYSKPLPEFKVEQLLSKSN